MNPVPIHGDYGLWTMDSEINDIMPSSASVVNNEVLIVKTA